MYHDEVESESGEEALPRVTFDIKNLSTRNGKCQKHFSAPTGKHYLPKLLFITC